MYDPVFINLLEKNVKDLQEQLRNANIRIKQLNDENYKLREMMEENSPTALMVYG